MKDSFFKDEKQKITAAIENCSEITEQNKARSLLIEIDERPLAKIVFASLEDNIAVTSDMSFPFSEPIYGLEKLIHIPFTDYTTLNPLSIINGSSQSIDDWKEELEVRQELSCIVDELGVLFFDDDGTPIKWDSQNNKPYYTRPPNDKQRSEPFL